MYINPRQWQIVIHCLLIYYLFIYSFIIYLFIYYSLFIYYLFIYLSIYSFIYLFCGVGASHLLAGLCNEGASEI